MNTYQTNKEKARQEAITWQLEYAENSYSYSELAYYEKYFTRLARRYGLVKEFTENGII